MRKVNRQPITQVVPHLLKSVALARSPANGHRGPYCFGPVIVQRRDALRPPCQACMDVPWCVSATCLDRMRNPEFAGLDWPVVGEEVHE
jgi:hypothetical protein